jgi:rhamnose utilization protein RhaD (predicted bifunctional aldolase and dehydrogenase)
VAPTLRLISRSNKPEAAAQALGFTPISMDKLKEYAKQHKITEDQAAMALSTQPNHPYYVVGYPYGQ